MYAVKSNVEITSLSSFARDLIDEFLKSDYRQVEILDWEDNYLDVYSARASFGTLIRRHYKGRLCVNKVENHLYLTKSEKEIREPQYVK